MSNKTRRELVEGARNRQIIEDTITEAMEVYKKLPDGNGKDQLREVLRQYLFNNHFSLVVTPARPMSPVFKKLIRDDCEGKIVPVPNCYLSEAYREVRKDYKGMIHAPEVMTEVLNSGMPAKRLYGMAMRNSKSWQDIRQFKTYRAIEMSLLDAFIREGFSPSIVEKMTINDYRDFTNEHCAEDFAAAQDKNSYIKRFINEREYAFSDMLRKNGENEFYAGALIKKMKEEGVTSDFKVLDKNGYVVKGTELGDHHKKPVYSPDDIQSISEVNDDKYRTLFDKRFHSYLHQLERRTYKDGQIHYEKIMVPEYSACILNFETYLLHDFDNPERHLPVPKPKMPNSIFLNKISELTIKLKKEAQTYNNKPNIKKNGRGNQRSGGRL